MAQDWPPHAWFAGLESCRDTDYRTFNDSWLEGLEQIEADNDTDQVGQSERQYAIREWLRRPGETEKLKTKTDKIMDVLAGADIQMLRAEKPPLEELTRPVAMLDDRNFATGRARGNRGPQSAFSLYWLLKKKRFRVHGSANLEQTDEDEPDADRRLLYLTNLDRWSIMALIGTASFNQVHVLQDALYNHLAFETSIDTKPLPAGLPIFHLAFHLPYYAWRSSSTPRQDSRFDRKRHRLRQSWDVSFLDPGNKQTKAFLHQAHISCVVTGSDLRKWCAYQFNDTSFDSDSDSPGNSVQSIEELRQDDDYSADYDPFTGGATDANQPIWDPTVFFSLILRVRLYRIHQEWIQVVTKLQESFKMNEPPPGVSCCQRDGYFGWLLGIKNLTSELSEYLSRTVRALERFCDSPANSQLLFESTISNGGVFDPHIGTSLEGLKDLDDKLAKMSQRCKDIEGCLQLEMTWNTVRMSMKAVEINTHQGQLARDNKGLSIVMAIFCPLVLTSSIFSIANLEKVMPFLHPSPRWFVILTVVISISTVALYYCFQDGADYWRKARKGIIWATRSRDTEGQLPY